jgi:hypothetical protein
MHEYASIHNFKQRVSGVRVGVQNFTITSLMIKLSRGSGPKYISEFSFQILSMRKLYLRQKSQNYQPSENHTFHTFYRSPTLSTDTPYPEAERLVTTANVTPKTTNSNDIQQHVNSANSGDVDIRNLTVTLIRTVVLQRSWYQTPGCSVQ